MSEFLIDVLNQNYGARAMDGAGTTTPLSMSRTLVERELVHLGLMPKEAQVYLASLELGPASVQEISKQSGVNRATAYVTIESLIDNGLMSSIERGAKTLFSAEPPERLKQVVRREEERIRGAREAMDKILPELSVLLSSAPERPRVRFYEGLEGLEAMRADFFNGAKKSEVLLISAADDYHKIVGMARRLPHAKRIEQTRGMERCIFTSKRSSDELKKSMPVVDCIERYRIPEKNYPLAGEIAVSGSKIAMLSYRGKVMGVLVESPFLAQTVTSLFNLAWETAKQHEKFD